MDRPSINSPRFRHLRTRVLRLSDASYLVLLSNAYDARIDVAMSVRRSDGGAGQAGSAGGRTDVVGVTMAVDADSSVVHRAAFDLSGERGLSWEPVPDVIYSGGLTRGRTQVRVTLGPYEVQVYRVGRGSGS